MSDRSFMGEISTVFAASFFINSREIDLIEFIFFNDYRLFLITLYFMRMGSTFLYFKGENLNLTK